LVSMTTGEVPPEPLGVLPIGDWEFTWFDGGVLEVYEFGTDKFLLMAVNTGKKILPFNPADKQPGVLKFKLEIELGVITDILDEGVQFINPYMSHPEEIYHYFKNTFMKGSLLYINLPYEYTTFDVGLEISYDVVASSESRGTYNGEVIEDRTQSVQLPFGVEIPYNVHVNSFGNQDKTFPSSTPISNLRDEPFNITDNCWTDTTAIELGNYSFVEYCKTGNTEDTDYIDFDDSSFSNATATTINQKYKGSGYVPMHPDYPYSTLNADRKILQRAGDVLFLGIEYIEEHQTTVGTIVKGADYESAYIVSNGSQITAYDGVFGSEATYYRHITSDAFYAKGERKVHKEGSNFAITGDKLVKLSTMESVDISYQSTIYNDIVLEVIFQTDEYRDFASIVQRHASEYFSV